MKLPIGLRFFVVVAFTVLLGACANPPAPATQPSTASATTPPPPATSVPVAPVAAKPTSATPAPVVVASPAIPASSASPAVAKVDFNRQVKPFFADYCYQCHGLGKRSGGVRLDVRSEALRFIVPGDPVKSDVYRAITRGMGTSDHMPPVSQYQPEASEIAMIKQWILEGAPWPEGS